MVISPLTGAVLILLTAKVYAKPVLKIFALTACGYVLFLLSANIFQATFSIREGSVLKVFKINYIIGRVFWSLGASKD